MTPEIGYAMTAVALGLALYGGVAAALGVRTGRPALIQSSQHAALGVFVLITAAML